MVCPSCKKVMKKGSAFCSKCGTDLRTEDETEEDATEERASDGEEVLETFIENPDEIFEEE